mmetsp:Transcript_81934/g.254326  ORF Transcript_81934/g.254326 Transcript_81934/m.254326 type:complete len:176 (+) Transcript_81934:1-528(+)
MRAFGLREEDLAFEQFNAFELDYPDRAPRAWVGAPVAGDACTAEERFRLRRLNVRALNMRKNFGISPVAVCRRDGPARRYVLPATGRTEVNGGDKLLFVCPGLPGERKQLPDFRVVKASVDRLRSIAQVTDVNSKEDISKGVVFDRTEQDILFILPPALLPGDDEESPASDCGAG